MIVRTVTVDFWGTLLFDGPSADDRYRRRRLADFQTILAGAGITVDSRALERGYDASGSFLGKIWRTNRDVPVGDHVRAILVGADGSLADRVPADVRTALVDAYARPALAVPPAVDPGARPALAALRERGVTLALVSNTMRTPGATLRKLLAHYGLLELFAHTTFSDEVGVRKPDAAIFAMTLAAVGGAPESTVHVGDDPVLDIQGGQAAGLRVIQVAGIGSERPRPEAVIASLAALPDAIAALEAR